MNTTNATSHIKKIFKKVLFFVMPICETFRANAIMDKEIADHQRSNAERPYSGIPVSDLRFRMKQEHERDQLIDAKTDRLGQRIMGMLAFWGVLFALSPVAKWSEFEKISGFVSLFYIVCAWWLAVKANETTKVYGFGTYFELEWTLSRELYCQEKQNTKKSNINCASVYCLRNALITGILGVLGSWVYSLFP